MIIFFRTMLKNFFISSSKFLWKRWGFAGTTISDVWKRTGVATGVKWRHNFDVGIPKWQNVGEYRQLLTWLICCPSLYEKREFSHTAGASAEKFKFQRWVREASKVSNRGTVVTFCFRVTFWFDSFGRFHTSRSALPSISTAFLFCEETKLHRKKKFSRIFVEWNLA